MDGELKESIMIVASPSKGTYLRLRLATEEIATTFPMFIFELPAKVIGLCVCERERERLSGHLRGSFVCVCV